MRPLETAAEPAVRHRHRALVLVGSVDRRLVPALRFSLRLSDTEVRALHVSVDAEETRRVARAWMELDLTWLPLHIRDGSSGSFLESICRVVEDELDQSGDLTVILPEVERRGAISALVHRRSARRIAHALRAQRRLTTVIVPYFVSAAGSPDGPPPRSSPAWRRERPASSAILSTMSTKGGRHPTGVTARVDHLNRLHDELRRAYGARDGSGATDEAWARAAREFADACQAFYGPYEAVLVDVRRGETEAIEEAVRFLVADPWCFRSGYLKADLMHALANTPLPDHVLGPLRDVVLRRITHREPRLLRYAAQLASNVWSDAFGEQLETLAAHGPAPVQHAARSVIDGARQRTRSLSGARAKAAHPRAGEG